MSGPEVAFLFIAVLLVLMALRVPIAVAMLVTGIAGYVWLAGWAPLLNYLKTAAYWRFAAYDLSVIPLFLLMGQFATRAGVSRSLFQACHLWLGHLRGGLAMATVGACAAFGAICGSSLATASTMGQVALPEMRRHGYSGALATGTLAAGGTLGILIPPSIVLVLYAILTEQNIVTMFIAALVPGLIAVAGYLLAIACYVRLWPQQGQAAPKAARSARLRALGQVWQVLLIFFLVIGGIYLGWFTPTEAAAVGAVATGLLAFVKGGMGRQALAGCLLETAQMTAMIFLILLGADLFNIFLALSRLPVELADLAAAAPVSPFLVLAAILLLYLLLGCVMDSLSMILLTVPIFYPIVAGLDFGITPDETVIWFGILALIVVEIGLITPPVGLNVFIINRAAGDVALSETFRGIWPFLLADLMRVGLLLGIPGLTLWLVRLWN